MNITFKVKGCGKPCFLLHGGPGMDASYFSPYLDSLADQLKLYAIDLRGCGLSPRLNSADYTMEGMVGDLEELRIAKRHEKVILLGHSFGGFLGLEYALKFPDRVAGLILVASAAHLKFVRETGKATKHFPQVAQAQKTYLESNRDEIALKKLILASIPLYFSKGFELEAKSLLAKINYGAKCYAELIKNYHSQFSLLKQLADINVPCLVIAGENDLPIPPKYSLEMVEQLQDAEYAELKTGHFPFVEKPSEFNEIVLTWLRNRHLLDA